MCIYIATIISIYKKTFSSCHWRKCLINMTRGKLKTSLLQEYINRCTWFLPCVHDKLLQSCLTLCELWTVVCHAPLSLGLILARILEWLVISSSRGIFPPQGLNPCLLRLLPWWVGSLPPGKAHKSYQSISKRGIFK